jgi:hypothetical protein
MGLKETELDERWPDRTGQGGMARDKTGLDETRPIGMASDEAGLRDAMTGWGRAGSCRTEYRPAGN